MTKKVTKWQGIPSDFSSEGYQGFVYLVTNLITGQKYIGRKYFSAKRSVKVKGKVRRKRTVKPSDWLCYKGSCKPLLLDIERLGEKNFSFEVLSLHKTRAETNYEETKQQFLRDVLYSKIGDMYEYYNTNILSRYYRSRAS